MADNYSLKYVFESVDNISNSLASMKRGLKDFQKGVGGADKKVKTFEATMRKTAAGLRSFASQTRAMSLVAATALTGSAYAFSKFEKGVVNVQSLLSLDQIKKYGGELEKLSKGAIAAGFGIDESNKALFDTISALGLSDASLKAFKEAQVLAKGGAAELSVSVRGIAKIMNVYGRETSDAYEITNALFTAQKVGTTTVQDLAQNVGKVSGISKAAGMSFQEMLSTLSVLTNALTNTEEAAVSMNAILKAVVNPGKQSKLILSALGIETGVTAVKTKGFAGVLKQLRGAMVEHEDALAMAIPNIRALKGALTLTDESLKLMDDTVKMINKDIKNGTGLTDAYKRQQDTLDQSILQLKGSLFLIGIEIGQVLAPYIKILAEKVIILYKWFNSLDMKNKKLYVGLIALAAIISPIALAFATVAGIAAFLGTNILLISFAIAATVTAITGAFIYFDGFIDYINKMIDRVGALIEVIPGLGMAFKIMDMGAKFLGEKIVGSPELVQPQMNKNIQSMNQSMSADVNVNLNAPKGTVSKVSSETQGTGMILGLNMAGVR